jgi:signal transduction histidine kinase
MSHEFRTPLNAILGYTRMLLQGVSGPLATEQAKDLSRVDSNAATLLSLINDILDISRIEAGKMPLNVSLFAVPVLMGEVLRELDPIVAQSGLEVVTDLDESAPPIRSDRQKVKQVVLNLLSNALKFTREGRVTLAASRQAGGETWIAVTDTGIGIAPENQQTIFEDFQQVDSSLTREYGGTGLGLAISARLAAMLGGRIALASELGKGSTFTLILPEHGGDG